MRSDNKSLSLIVSLFPDTLYLVKCGQMLDTLSYVHAFYSDMRPLSFPLLVLALLVFTIEEARSNTDMADYVSKPEATVSHTTIEDILLCAETEKMDQSDEIQDLCRNEAFKKLPSKRFTLANNPVLIRFAQRQRNRLRMLAKLKASYARMMLGSKQ